MFIYCYCYTDFIGIVDLCLLSISYVDKGIIIINVFYGFNVIIVCIYQKKFIVIIDIAFVIVIGIGINDCLFILSIIYYYY